MSDLEELLALALRATNLPAAKREYRFHPVRRWRFDFAWPAHKAAVEVEGGVWTSGRHTRGSGFVADCDKYNTAVLMGWRVLRVPGPRIAEDPMGVVDDILRLLENTA